MKKVVWLAGVLFILFFAVKLTQNTQAGEPKLLIPETSFDYGFVPPRCTLSHYYLVKNAGTDSLKIKEVKPG
jgi:hypothetical protein